MAGLSHAQPRSLRELMAAVVRRQIVTMKKKACTVVGYCVNGASSQAPDTQVVVIRTMTATRVATESVDLLNVRPGVPDASCRH